MSCNWCWLYPLFSEVILDAVIDRKVDGPSGEVAKDSWTEPAVHAPNAIVLEDVLDCVWIRTQERVGETYVEQDGLQTPNHLSYKPLTSYALVAVVATLDALGLELGLDHIERTCRYAGDEAASRAS